MKRQLDWMNQKIWLEETTKNTIWLDEKTTWPDEKKQFDLIWLDEKTTWLDESRKWLEETTKNTIWLVEKTTWSDEKTIWLDLKNNASWWKDNLTGWIRKFLTWRNN